MNEKKGVILLSGGLDSATVAAIAKNVGYSLHALTFRYGQKHNIEIAFAKRLAEYFNVSDHIIIDIPSQIFQSALVGTSNVEIPKNQEILKEDHIPVTYVPGRNILFLSYALAYGESINAESVFIGANAVDYSGYPDCRPEFFESFQKVSDTGTSCGISGKGITIETPVIMMKKSEIIERGIELGVDYSLTHSCYDPFDDGTSCGGCDSCQLRKMGFSDAGIPDPTKYRI